MVVLCAMNYMSSRQFSVLHVHLWCLQVASVHCKKIRYGHLEDGRRYRVFCLLVLPKVSHTVPEARQPFPTFSAKTGQPTPPRSANGNCMCLPQSPLYAHLPTDQQMRKLSDGIGNGLGGNVRLTLAKLAAIVSLLGDNVPNVSTDLVANQAFGT